MEKRYRDTTDRLQQARQDANNQVWIVGAVFLVVTVVVSVVLLLYARSMVSAIAPATAQGPHVALERVEGQGGSERSGTEQGGSGETALTPTQESTTPATQVPSPSAAQEDQWQSLHIAQRQQDSLLKVIMPLFGLGFTFAIGFLGLKRLGQFDSEINTVRRTVNEQITIERDQLRRQLSDVRDAVDESGKESRQTGERREERFRNELTEIRRDAATQIEQEREKASQDRKEFAQETGRKVSEMKDSIKLEAKEQVASVIDKRKRELQQGLSEFDRKTKAYMQEIQEELQPFAWLHERKDEATEMAGVLTMGIAHDRVTEFHAAKKPDLALRVAQHAIEQKLAGTNDDYHNMAAQLARHEHFTLADRVIRVGLERYPDDVDLLADAVKFRSSTGELDKAEQAYEALQSIPKDRWNWRAFVFAGDFLELASRIDDAMELYREFREVIPDDERGYSQPGTYYHKLGRYTEAIELLAAGVENCSRAPQAALMLAKTYIEIGRYEEAVTAASRALEANASEQPSVNQSSVLWTRANALDSLILQSVERELAKDPEWSVDVPTLRLAQACGSDYKTCLQMEDCLFAFKVRGPQRLRILRALLQQQGAPPQFLEQAFGGVESPNAQAQQLMQLFQHMQQQGGKGGEEPDE